MTLFRYLAKEILLTMLVIVVVLMLVLVCSQFIVYLQQLSNGGIGLSTFFKLLVIQVPLLIGYVLPMGFYLAGLIVIGQLSLNSEMVVLLACGVSYQKITRFLFVLGCIVALMTAMVMLFLEPKMQGYRLNLLYNVGHNYSIEKVLPKTFLREQNSVLYASNKENNTTLQHVFFQNQSKVKNTSHLTKQIITAKQAREEFDEKTLTKFLVLKNGYRYVNTSQLDYQIVRFHQFRILISQANHDLLGSRAVKLESVGKLWAHRDESQSAAELHWRLAMPISVLILSLLILPFAVQYPREKRGFKFFLAILVYVAYVNFLFTARNWIESGAVSVVLGMWWLHALLLLIAVAANIWLIKGRR